MEINNLILEIIKLSLEKNTKEKNTIFCEFYGHCNCLNLRLYKDGWKEYSDATYTTSVYLDAENVVQKMNMIIDYLKKLEE